MAVGFGKCHINRTYKQHALSAEGGHLCTTHIMKSKDTKIAPFGTSCLLLFYSLSEYFGLNFIFYFNLFFSVY
jgi:hypothetical protein